LLSERAEDLLRSTQAGDCLAVVVGHTSFPFIRFVAIRAMAMHPHACAVARLADWFALAFFPGLGFQVWTLAVVARKANTMS
jgi:hypothetical protein